MSPLRGWPRADGDPCTIDSCNSGICTNTPIDCDAVALECDGLGTPNTGETEIFGQVESSVVLCLSSPISMPVVHRIVTHDTMRSRDLHGMLRLSSVSGDPAVIDIRYLDEPYALDSPIPVIEPGHSGCDEHTWHSGVATFTLIPRSAGEVTLKAQVDPDPECCEGDGVPTVEAQVTVTVMEVTASLTLSPSSIAAKTGWTGMPAGLNQSDITVTWDPPECVGTLEIVKVDPVAGYLPPNDGVLTPDPDNDNLWHYTAFDEPQTVLCPKEVKVWIGAMQGDAELSRKSVLVLAVHTFLTTGANADFGKDYVYLSLKYGAVLGTTGGAFSSVMISANGCVPCARFPFDPNPPCVYACTTDASVVFGTNTFSSTENQAASIIGHELMHTVGADECEAYQWEADHSQQTGIWFCDTTYLESVLQQLANPEICP